MRLEQYFLLTLATAPLSWLVVHAANASCSAQDEASIAATISNELGWKIFSCLSGSSAQDNLIFSPVSLSTSLAILYYGALGNSSQEIRSEISSLLQSSSSPSQCNTSADVMDDKTAAAAAKHSEECYCPPGPYFRALLTSLRVYNTTNATIDIANSIWHHGHLHSLFKRKVTNYFRPELMILNPRKPTVSASEINEWVNNITRGKISNVINPDNIQESDKVFLFNVLYFRSLWATPFTADDYTKRFISCSACHDNRLNLTTEGSIEEVQFIEKVEHVPYCEMSSLTAIRMAYTNSNISMTIILPKQLCRMRAVEDELINSNLLQRINYCLVPRKVGIILPKFDLKQELPISSILAKLGLRSLYHSSSGGFSTILQKSRNLQLSKVSHQSVLEVNEKGSEAAAVTGITFDAVSFPPEFKADHPFIVLISEHTTGAILFMGRLCSPLTNSGMVDITTGPHCDSSFSGNGPSD